MHQRQRYAPTRTTGAGHGARGAGKPGEVYHYSDTGCILLGEILETVTGQPMPHAVRELVGTPATECGTPCRR
ncbi:MAG: serine hydrolase [Gemmatimonadales bacterium]